MMNVDEDALICDFAETYNIYDFKRLSPKQAATFCIGLRPNSRIMMKMSNLDYPIETIFLAMSVDALTYIAWSKTEEATRGEGRPKSVLNLLLGTEDVRNNEVFSSAEEFEEMRRNILEGMQCRI